MNEATRGGTDDLRGEFRSYCIGAALALVLTMAAFALVAWEIFEPLYRLIAIAALAAVQIVFHFHYFLHINLRKSHRDELQLILFTGLILFLMAAGTIWILWDLHFRMT